MWNAIRSFGHCSRLGLLLMKHTSRQARVLDLSRISGLGAARVRVCDRVEGEEGS